MRHYLPLQYKAWLGCAVTVTGSLMLGACSKNNTAPTRVDRIEANVVYGQPVTFNVYGTGLSQPVYVSLTSNASPVTGSTVAPTGCISALKTGTQDNEIRTYTCDRINQYGEITFTIKRADGETLGTKLFKIENNTAVTAIKTENFMYGQDGKITVEGTALNDLMVTTALSSVFAPPALIGASACTSLTTTTATPTQYVYTCNKIKITDPVVITIADATGKTLSTNTTPVTDLTKVTGITFPNGMVFGTAGEVLVKGENLTSLMKISAVEDGTTTTTSSCQALNPSTTAKNSLTEMTYLCDKVNSYKPIKFSIKNSKDEVLSSAVATVTEKAVLTSLVAESKVIFGTASNVLLNGTDLNALTPATATGCDKFTFVKTNATATQSTYTCDKVTATGEVSVSFARATGTPTVYSVKLEPTITKIAPVKVKGLTVGSASDFTIEGSGLKSGLLVIPKDCGTTSLVSETDTKLVYRCSTVGASPSVLVQDKTGKGLFNANILINLKSAIPVVSTQPPTISSISSAVSPKLYNTLDFTVTGTELNQPIDFSANYCDSIDVASRTTTSIVLTCTNVNAVGELNLVLKDQKGVEIKKQVFTVGQPQVKLTTSKGDIVLELNPDKAPISVANYLNYVNTSFYSNLIFHRVIKNFMIQTGQFLPITATTTDLVASKTVLFAPIKSEAQNGLKNLKGTVAMARTPVLDSATSQFYINTVDNASLDYPSNGGYAVFGKVVSGLTVVETIGVVPTRKLGSSADVPVDDVLLISAVQTQ